MRHLLVPAALAAGLLAPSAAQASCVAPEPREDRLAKADVAFVGTVLRREDSSYVLRVERTVKGTLGGEARVRDRSPNSSIAMNLQPGQRVGLLLRAEGLELVGNDCLSPIGPDDLIAATAAAPCKAGARPAARYRSRRYAFRPRVLGCGRTPAGVPFQLVGYRLAGSKRPCLDLVRLPKGPAAGCGDGRIRGTNGVDVDGRAGSLLSGTTDSFAGGVAVRYRVRTGQEETRQAALVVVDGARTLRGLRLKRPFATWVADFPQDAAATGLELHFPRGGAAGPFPLG